MISQEKKRIFSYFLSPRAVGMKAKNKLVGSEINKGSYRQGEQMEQQQGRARLDRPFWAKAELSHLIHIVGHVDEACEVIGWGK